MFKDTKIPLIILSVISIILLCSTIVLFVQKESEKSQKLSFQKRLNETIIIKEALEKKLKDAEDENTELTANLKTLEEKINTLSGQLEEEKTANTKTAAKLKKKEFDIKGLNLNVENAKAEKEDLQKQLAVLNEDYLKIRVQAEDLTKTKEELEKKVKELAEKEGVSLGTIIVKK